jgi:hypothetical protein
MNLSCLCIVLYHIMMGWAFRGGTLYNKSSLTINNRTAQLWSSQWQLAGLKVHRVSI